MGWLYPHEHERRRRETVKLLRTDNGTEVRERTLSEVLSKREKPTRAHRGRWAEAQQHIRFPSAPRLFPGKLPNLHRLWVQAAMYVHERPKYKHCMPARGALEYLKLKSIYGITFKCVSGFELVVYAGAAYAPLDTRR